MVKRLAVNLVAKQGCLFRQREHRLYEVNVNDAACVLLTQFRVLGMSSMTSSQVSLLISNLFAVLCRSHSIPSSLISSPPAHADGS